MKQLQSDSQDKEPDAPHTKCKWSNVNSGQWLHHTHTHTTTYIATDACRRSTLNCATKWVMPAIDEPYTHTYTMLYIYVCICICVCLYINFIFFILIQFSFFNCCWYFVDCRQLFVCPEVYTNRLCLMLNNEKAQFIILLFHT